MSNYTIYSIEKLKADAAHKSKLFLYGAGAVGEAVLTFLRDFYLDGALKGFLVSPGRKTRDTAWGLPVYSLDEIVLEPDSFVLVTAMENIQAEMAETLGGFTRADHALLDNGLCAQLLRYRQTGKFAGGEEPALRDALIRLTPQPRLKVFVLNIVDHCNLNCAGCDHFAPLARERCVPYETVAKDIKRMSALMEQNVERVSVMGGEPLLHPRLLDILTAVRKSFPHSVIRLVTNGVLLLKQEEAFWRVCRGARVTIVNTKYPIHLDYAQIEKLSAENGVRYEYYDASGETVSAMHKIVMDSAGAQEPRDSFSRCHHANDCVTLMEGRLFTCTVAPNAHIFNEYFHEHLEVCGDDFLDIYDPSLTKRAVLDFLARPIPFCRYCDVKHRDYGQPWRVSKAERAEWTLDQPAEERI